MTLENKIVCLMIVLLVALAPNSSCRHETPGVCREFYDLSGQQREKEFPTYLADKQLDIYRCEMQRKPPASGWAYDIAKGGEKKLPFVIDRLKAERDHVMQYHFIHLLQVMSEQPYFRGRQDVVDQVREVISRMSYSPARTQAQEALSEIEKNAKGD
ncbi:MAG: hypothetical protein ACR2LM_03070 [Pyrinomonadaceae bacterium]